MSEKCPKCGAAKAPVYTEDSLVYEPFACDSEWHSGRHGRTFTESIACLRRQLAQRDEQLAEKETEIAALGQELADLKETEKELWDQCITDQICFYRNLAIRYGAKPEDMDNEWDTGLAEDARAKDTKLAALKAVVEKLPKTADGVSVAPGDVIWVRTDDEGIQRDFVGQPLPAEFNGHEIANCYSTREAAEGEAAEAAAEAEKGPRRITLAEARDQALATGIEAEERYRKFADDEAEKGEDDG